MGPKNQQLLQTICTYHLDDRSAEVRHLRQMIEAGMVDEYMAEAMLYGIQDMVDEQERRPNYLHRVPEYDELYPKGEPDLIIGHLSENEDIPIGLNLDGAFHVMFAGMTGYGKTIGIRVLFRAITKYNRKHPEAPVSLIVFDRKGHDYGDATYLLGDNCLHLDVHGDMRIGLNGPDGLPANIWVNHIASNFCAPSGLRFAWVTVANMIRFCLGRMNKTPSSPLNYPDFEVLLRLAKGPCGRIFASKSEYLDSLIQVLEGIIQASGKLFHTFNGMDLERDVISQGKSAIISMPNLSPAWLRQFVAYVLIDQVLLRRMYLGIRVPRTQVIFVTDEANADVSHTIKQAFPDGMSPYVKSHRMGREFGIGNCLGLGNIGDVDREILDSVGYHFIFRMENPESLVDGQRTMHLPHRGHELLSALEKGECLVRLPGTWPHTMLGRITTMGPNLNPPARYDSLPFVPSKPLSEVPELVEAVMTMTDQVTAQAMRRSKAKKHMLPETASKLLALAAEHPWITVAGLWRIMGGQILPEARKTAVAKLAKLGLAQFEDLRIGKTSYRLIQIQPNGWEYLGKKSPHIRGRGGISHVTCAHWIANTLKTQGYSAEIEWEVPQTSHHADVATQMPDGRWTVYEVVIACESNLTASIRACLLQSKAVACVIVVAAQQKYLVELSETVNTDPDLQEDLARIRYENITNFMTEV